MSNTGSANSSVPALQSVADVKALNAKQLTVALKRFGLSISGKRDHKIRVLCEVLGLTPTDDNFKKILSYVKTCKNGWTKDIRNCPCMSLSDVTSYLLRAHDTVVHKESGDLNKEDFTPENIRRYKTLRSYELYRSGHAHSMMYNHLVDSPLYCCVKCKCNPSWDTSGTVYDAIVVFNRVGQPIGSQCSCTAGQGEACSHVAGMLFALEDFTSLGYHSLPANPSSTEVMCSWNAPKNVKVEPRPLKELQYQCRAPCRKEAQLKCRKKK